ncbi:helix-turn-helix domain-containing protein [Streptomyces umbrinus]
MPNYDAQSMDEDAADTAEHARHTEAVSFEVDERLEPTDSVTNAKRGQLGDSGDMEKLASFNLRRIRQALGLSQQQIADKLAEKPDRVRLSQSQIAKMERGERPWRLNEMYDIADALGIETIEFSSGQLSSDSADLQVLAARLNMQAAWEVARVVEEEYKAAVRKALEADLKLVHTCVHLGLKDEMAMSILAGQAERADEVELIVDELNDPRPRISIEESRRRGAEFEEQQKRHRVWAEKEWERLVKQHAEKARQSESE